MVMNNKIEIQVIASGSTGNCYLLKGVENNLLIECGIPFKKIRTSLYKELAKVSGVLVTHEHKDHCKSVNDFTDLGFTVYASQGTLDSVEIEKRYNTTVIKAQKRIKIDEWDVVPFKTEHDCAEPLGFLILNTITKERLVFITDSYYVEYTFDNLDYVMIECNYEMAYVEKHMDEIPHSYRLLNSHMSYENCLEFLKANDLSKVKKIYLLHLSSRHANAMKFRKGVVELTGIPTIVAGVD